MCSKFHPKIIFNLKHMISCRRDGKELFSNRGAREAKEEESRSLELPSKMEPAVRDTGKSTEDAIGRTKEAQAKSPDRAWAVHSREGQADEH